MAVSLVAIAGLSPVTAPILFRALLVVHNAFAALQDVTSDALAIERLPEAERGKANGVMAGGKWAGTLVGGPGVAFVSSKLGWPAACFAAVALLLVPATLALLLEERPTTPSAPDDRSSPRRCGSSRCGSRCWQRSSVSCRAPATTSSTRWCCPSFARSSASARTA
jgi:MFS family permease